MHIAGRDRRGGGLCCPDFVRHVGDGAPCREGEGGKSIPLCLFSIFDVLVIDFAHGRPETCLRFAKYRHILVKLFSWFFYYCCWSERSCWLLLSYLTQTLTKYFYCWFWFWQSTTLLIRKIKRACTSMWPCLSTRLLFYVLGCAVLCAELQPIRLVHSCAIAVLGGNIPWDYAVKRLFHVLASKKQAAVCCFSALRLRKPNLAWIWFHQNLWGYCMISTLAFEDLLNGGDNILP